MEPRLTTNGSELREGAHANDFSVGQSLREHFIKDCPERLLWSLLARVETHFAMGTHGDQMEYWGIPMINTL